MACRCSGAGSAAGCNCSVEAGPGIDVFGTGASGDPYVITLVAAPARWWDGEGPPDPEPEGSQAGDYYLDTTTGDVWQLAGDDASGGAVLIGNIRGPAGPEGPTGPEGPAGPQGDPGTGVDIQGSVPTQADLPTLGPEDAGTGYITEDTGHLWVWDGTQWVDAGEIRGPQGEPGPAGPSGGHLATVVFTESGSFIKGDYPDGNRVRVRGVGGGGGGGSAGAGASSSGVSSLGGGAGGGGYFEKWIPFTDLADTETVTVGTGGTWAAQTDLALGETGGTTSFAGCEALGGAGGQTSTNRPVEGHVANRGLGGVSSGGDLNIDGDAGSNGTPYDEGRRGFGGTGGGTVLGASIAIQTVGVNNAIPGLRGRPYGGGGSGAYTGRDYVQTGVVGGAGADGVVIVEVYS